ncbi:hypothetical protein JAO05_13720 [Burkholderia pseudomallei]|uniref:hypothetical protein n=1 Tax=Burkholderia pseudomallei TaxID=28450 RepID=UPI00156005B4|nr:hypothetical protein [Burkholderia pseudomallei]MBH9656168.1 hypothetical protein [Burkholderia pseudomallei]
MVGDVADSARFTRNARRSPAHFARPPRVIRGAAADVGDAARVRIGCGLDAERMRGGDVDAEPADIGRAPIPMSGRRFDVDVDVDADAGPIEQPDVRAGEPGAPQPPPTTARRLLRAASRPSRRAISGRRSAARCR